MKIAGHRGAAGMALENSLEAIRSGIRAGVDAIEIDVRQTASGDFVLSHDASISRVSNKNYNIPQENTDTITSVIMNNGEAVPTIEQAFVEAKDLPILLDVKGSNWAKPLAIVLKQHQDKNVSVIAFNHPELSKFHQLLPAIPVFAIERTKPFEVITDAKQYGFNGVDFNFWILNPLTYWLAKRQGLSIIVYTVNHVWIGRFMRLFFPDITLTTDVPHKMQTLRSSKESKS